MKTIFALGLALAGLGCKKADGDKAGDTAKADLCTGAVTHLMSLQKFGNVSAEETSAIDAVVAMTIPACRAEGLSQAQAACILAAHWVGKPGDAGFDPLAWAEQVRACPAFAAKPLSWVFAGQR